MKLISLFFSAGFGSTLSAQYYGRPLGKLSQLAHGLSGEVYAVDARTLYLKDFTYDGEGPGKLTLIHFWFLESFFSV